MPFISEKIWEARKEEEVRTGGLEDKHIGKGGTLSLRHPNTRVVDQRNKN